MFLECVIIYHPVYTVNETTLTAMGLKDDFCYILKWCGQLYISQDASLSFCILVNLE